MSSLIVLILLTFSLLEFVHVQAPDPEPLQDFCVADLYSNVYVNGYPCKNPSTVTSSDFYYHGLAERGDTNNTMGATATQAYVGQFPGLNTFGIAIARIDYGPYGLNTLHLHPRSSEVLMVTEGTLLAGFVTTDPNHTFFSKTLEKGDAFIFPRGLVHFQQNLKNKNASAVAAFNSQNPGRINIADASFSSNPPIPYYVLARAFHIANGSVDEIQDAFSNEELRFSERNVAI